MDETPLAEITVTCHTEGCENAGLPLTLLAAATDPYVVCGPCGQRITDLGS